MLSMFKLYLDAIERHFAMRPLRILFIKYLCFPITSKALNIIDCLANVVANVKENKKQTIHFHNHLRDKMSIRKSERNHCCW